MKAQRAENPVEKPESGRKERARNAQGTGMDASAGTARAGNPERWVHLLERVVERSNLQLAYKRVKANHGAAGVDGMSVDELPIRGRLQHLCEVETIGGTSACQYSQILMGQVETHRERNKE